MKISEIIGIYFSPTGGTQRIVETAIETLSARFSVPCRTLSYTTPANREQAFNIPSDALVVWGTPVYAGRIPNKTLPFVDTFIQGKGNPLIAIAVYGGRHYDNTLSEMVLKAKQGNMKPIGAAAMVSRHVFSQTLSKGRPSEEDLQQLRNFVNQVQIDRTDDLLVPGEVAPQTYYTPLKQDMQPAKFLKSKPSVDVNLCTRCGQCAEHCTMGSIRMEDGLPQFEGVCIKCQACVFHCSTHAIGIHDEQFLSHIQMLEENIKACRPCEFYG